LTCTYSRMRRAAAHLAKVIGREQRHGEHAEQAGDRNAGGRRQRWEENAQEHAADDEVKPTPDHFDDRRRFADAAWRRERRLEFIAANALR